jgi:peptidoglycan/xylan/chitin deacetylase (PgdA/CDA1 family)
MIAASSSSGAFGGAIADEACARADNVAASAAAPGGLSREQTPQFVSVGWDDNGDAEGVRWALGVHERTRGHASFFVNSIYGSSEAVKQAWIDAWKSGHEIGNHTAGHLSNRSGQPFTVAQWQSEIQSCTDFLIEAGILQANGRCGFRAPYLEYDDHTLTAIQELGFDYDCSIEEGHDGAQDGSNYYWPYTLDRLSPGHTWRVQHTQPPSPISELTPHAGLWELPVYALIAPPDERCAEYGTAPGLRALLQDRQPQFFAAATGKIVGFDYNLWAPVAGEGLAMSKSEFLATTKYSFDQHYAGNRAPFLLGAHTAFYVAAYDNNAPGTPRAADRRAAVEELLAYVTSKPGVRVVSHRELLDWLRNPQPL